MLRNSAATMNRWLMTDGWWSWSPLAPALASWSDQNGNTLMALWLCGARLVFRQRRGVSESASAACRDAHPPANWQPACSGGGPRPGPGRLVVCVLFSRSRPRHPQALPPLKPSPFPSRPPRVREVYMDLKDELSWAAAWNLLCHLSLELTWRTLVWNRKKTLA